MMAVPAAICLTVAVSLGLAAAAGTAWADRGWHDDRLTAPGCCAGSPSGGYQPAYPYRPYPVPPPILGPPVGIAPRAWQPPVVVVPLLPPATYARPPAEFVYWCDNPKGYYPNVINCSVPWREQSATTPR